MDFVFATNNLSKIKEATKILGPLGINIIPIDKIEKNFIMPDETGKTFEENAMIKAQSVYLLTKKPVIADDSGLEVDALNGEPGIYSARYAGENASDEDRINKLLFSMKGVPEKQRTAKFVCVICCILPGNEKLFARGECMGVIATEAVRQKGFGYDPIFIAKDGKAFSEISIEEKNSISHRGNALRQLYLKLKNKI